MFNQNWFDEKNYTMFIDETECRAYYDINTRNIYVVTEHHDGSNIKELMPGAKNYGELIMLYENRQNSSEKTYTVTFSTRIDIPVKASSVEEAKEKAVEMFENYSAAVHPYHIHVGDIVDIINRSENE